VQRLALLVLALLLALAGAAAAAQTPQAHDRDPVFSPGGLAIAFVRWDGTGTGRVMVMRRDGRDLHAVTPSQPQQSGLTWSPDGRSLAYTSGNDIWRVDLATERPLDLTHDAYDDWQPDWSPDGKQIVYDRFQTCFRCTALHVISAVDGSGDRDISPAGDYARRPQWSPDGTKIVLSLSGRLVVDPDGKTVVAGHGGSYASWSADGRQIVYIGDGVTLYDLATGATREISTKLHAYPMLSRDGATVGGTGFRGALTLLRVADGRVVATIEAADTLDDAPTWGADQRVAFVHAGLCGIDVVWGDGTHVHRLTRVC
jgi:Tol biopolymer transport system component